MYTKKLTTEAKIFLFLYFICFFSLYMGLIEGFPFAGILTRLKFIYIVFGIVFTVLNLQRVSKKILILSGLLVGYIVTFSTIFKNSMVSEYTENHFIMMLIYASMLLITYAQVRRHHCFISFVITSYWTIFLFLLIASLRNFSEMVLNPLYIVRVLFFDLRVRSDFGIAGTSNYVGAFAYVAFMLSFIYYYYLKTKERHLLLDINGMLIFISNIYLFLVFGSASSRSPIVSLMVFFVVFGLIQYNKLIKKFWWLLLAGLGAGYAVLTSIGFFDYVWKNSNREQNITANAEAFEQVGNFWTGMGYVENGIFNKASGFPWGVYTSSLDMFYVYLYYTTGFVGTLWMGIILLVMLVWIIKERRQKYFPVISSIYISVLFYAFWESIIFTYRFWPFMILFAILFMFIDGETCECG